MDQFQLPIWKKSPRWQPPESKAPARQPTRQNVDVAIIGAGFLGLSASLTLARNGRSVCILDKAAVGEGASGLNGGQVIPGLKYDPEWLLEHFGEARGQQMIAFGAGTADAVFDLMDRERLEVPHVRNGWIQAAHTETALAAAHLRNAQWQGRGANVGMLSADEISSLTGAQGYLGGWLDRRAGIIDPLSFVTELAYLATANGVRIVENCGVTSLRKDAGKWIVTGSDGTEVVCEKVLVATNAYTDGLIPGMARSLVPLHSFQIATEPLPEEIAPLVLQQSQAVSDSRRILVYYRKTADGRLVLGGRGRMAKPGSADDWRHLERAMLRLYPILDGIKIERRWYGRVAMTPDHLPHIHEPAPGLIAFVGCQGRGVGLMTSMGERLARFIDSGDREALPFPVSPIAPIPFHAFRQIGVAAMIAWYRMLDATER